MQPLTSGSAMLRSRRQHRPLDHKRAIVNLSL